MCLHRYILWKRQPTPFRISFRNSYDCFMIVTDIWHHECFFIGFVIGKTNTNNDIVTNINARISPTTYNCINCHRLSNNVCLEIQSKCK